MQYHAPLDPNCAKVSEFMSALFAEHPGFDVMGAPTVDIIEDFERRHRKTCKRCQLFGVANMVATWSPIGGLISNLPPRVQQELPDIFDYFETHLRVTPDDVSLHELPVDSVCGASCKQAIDAAATLLLALTLAHGEDSACGHRAAILNATEDIVETFWRG